MLRRCLDHLCCQGADELLVVDASDDTVTRDLVAEYEVRYIDFRGRRHQMPASRNVGIAHASCDIVAFLDDDSLARPGWLGVLLANYRNQNVGCVGGRVVDPTEPSSDDPTLVGLLLPDGTRIDNFNADPGRPLLVDRVRGCNMSFRRQILVDLGGFDRAYTGSNVNEASGMCLRVKRAGYDVFFEPQAIVDHLAAPREAIGRDPGATSTQFFLARNRAYLILKILGPTPAALRTLYWTEPLAALCRLRQTPSPGLSWVAAHLWGKLVGATASLGPRRTGLPHLASRLVSQPAVDLSGG